MVQRYPPYYVTYTRAHSEDLRMRTVPCISPRRLHGTIAEMKIAVFVLLASSVAAAGASGSCTSPGPSHVRLECIIASRESGQCSKWTEDGRQIHECDDGVACPAWTGMQLEISCSDDDALTLFKGNSTNQHNVSWTFATSSAVEGLYECRWNSGSLFANRSIQVDGEYIVPAPWFPVSSKLKPQVVTAQTCIILFQFLMSLSLSLSLFSDQPIRVGGMPPVPTGLTTPRRT